ncbi:MAG: glutamate mutase L [Peptococcaceae bacterium]|nr:glutamate mutase L [Peptococcaceae bacterium]
MSAPKAPTVKEANLLVYDVGSTYTKATAFRLEESGSLLFLARGQSPTTLEDVLLGAENARQSIAGQGVGLGADLRRYATCSAAGGLRMVALGYMPRVTAKAAKEVAMTAGARVMEVISYDEPLAYREEALREIRPDIILLAGGTDGGDRESVLENAEIIIRIKSKAMVVVACNKDAQARVAARFDAAGIPYVRVPNIMPTIHELNIKPAREAIHTQFIKQITKAKGLDRLQAMLADKTVMPTPGAVLLASELLAKGTYEQEGIGGLILADIGGATTDIHSALPELENLKPEERGLVINNEKQFSYRTVEGNLGLRVSATGIPEAVGPLSIIRDMGLREPPATPEEVVDYTRRMEKEPSSIPANQREWAMDKALALSAVAVALRRHAGHFAKEADPVLGLAAGTPVGRDLRSVKHVLAVGGIFYHTKTAEKQEIMTRALADPGISLLPVNPRFHFDDHYLLYALGVLSRHFPDSALSFLKNYIRT